MHWKWGYVGFEGKRGALVLKAVIFVSSVISSIYCLHMVLHRPNTPLVTGCYCGVLVRAILHLRNKECSSCHQGEAKLTGEGDY